MSEDNCAELEKEAVTQSEHMLNFARAEFMYRFVRDMIAPVLNAKDPPDNLELGYINHLTGPIERLRADIQQNINHNAAPWRDHVGTTIKHLSDKLESELCSVFGKHMGYLESNNLRYGKYEKGLSEIKQSNNYKTSEALYVDQREVGFLYIKDQGERVEIGAKNLQQCVAIIFEGYAKETQKKLVAFAHFDTNTVTYRGFGRKIW